MSRAQDLLEEGEKLVDGEDLPQALRKFKDALALFRKAGADYDAAPTALRIAILPDDVAGYRLRRKCARTAAAIFMRLGKLGEAANALNRVADIQLEKSRIFAGFGSWLARWYGKAAYRNRRKAIDL